MSSKESPAGKCAGPLTGTRIVDAGMLFAGPLVGAMLGDLGAEVIKIEHPKGDEARRLGRMQKGESLWWRVSARNKKLVSIDISQREGAQVTRQLIGTADVFIENFRPGRVSDWGLDYKTLSMQNPGLGGPSGSPLT